MRPKRRPDGPKRAGAGDGAGDSDIDDVDGGPTQLRHQSYVGLGPGAHWAPGPGANNQADADDLSGSLFGGRRGPPAAPPPPPQTRDPSVLLEAEPVLSILVHATPIPVEVLAASETEPEATTPDARSSGVKFRDAEELPHNPKTSSDADDPDALSPGTATKLGDTFRAYWRSRRARWLVAGTIIVLLVVILVVVVGASKRPPATAEERFNSTLPPYTIESLRNTSSPQYLAYVEVTQSDLVLEGDEEARLLRMTQRFALATLFYSFDHWFYSDMSSQSECEWGKAYEKRNVTCNPDSVVVSFFQHGKSRVPSPIPREIGLLTNLASLELSENSLLTSSIPTELGDLSALTHLRLVWNSLTSSIPTELGLLTNLAFLSLGVNSLTSSIPTELGRLSTLTELYLNDNSLTSSIPVELGQLFNLDESDLADNHLTGTIPGSLCSSDGIYITIDCEEVTCSCCNCSYYT